LKTNKELTIRIIGCVLGGSIGFILAIQFLNFLSNHIDFNNPTPVERLGLIVIALPFAWTAYYSFRKLGHLFKCSNSTYYKDYGYYEQEDSHTPIPIKHIYKAEHDHSKSDHSTENTQQCPPYKLPKIIHFLNLLHYIRHIIKLPNKGVNHNRREPYSPISKAYNQQGVQFIVFRSKTRTPIPKHDLISFSTFILRSAISTAISLYRSCIRW